MPDPAIAARLRSRVKARQLAALVAVADAGSLRRAAAALRVSQPALSKTVRELETTVGRRLFTRGHKGLSPTAHGLAVIEYARRLMRDIDALAATLDAVDAGAGGRLRLGVIPYVSSEWLHRVTGRLLAGVPSLALQISENPTDVLVAALRQRELDCVIGRMTPAIAGEDLVWRPVFEQSLRVVARSRHPLLRRGLRITLEHLTRFEWILPAATTPTRQLIDHLFMQAGLARPRARLETYSLRIIESLVGSGDFLAAVPDDIARQCTRDGEIRALPFGWPMPPISLVWSASDASLPLVRRLGEAAGLAAELLPRGSSA